MSDYRRERPAEVDSRSLTISRLANLAARTIHEGLISYDEAFSAITRRAQIRFEARDWSGMQEDAAARLDLYGAVIDDVTAKIRTLLADRLEHKLVWASLKAVYSGLIAARRDWELAETFFNSVTRRIFATVGVDADIEFVDTDFDSPPTQVQSVCRKYTPTASTVDLFKHILTDYGFGTPFADLQRDIILIAGAVQQRLQEIGALRVITRIEMVQPVFYRGKAAYLVGRLFSGVHIIPVVLTLFNVAEGLVVDTVLLSESDASILFSFARSYFHVDVDRPYDLVLFLRTIMPRKRVAEIYISLGYNKHGKTELYRDIRHHLAYSSDQFEEAAGEKGMVMLVFTMPDYDLVFKIIKDQFAYPKRTTQHEVKQKYRLVFKHDRAGRLVDAQEFEHLKFDRERFSPPLLHDLEQMAARNVELAADYVIIKHCYVERRVTPLNIYIHEAGEKAAIAAVLEYGNAIKDMAATDIFPGDLWLKNFGVTRHGRVVFYDYDELTLLSELRFRMMPPARHYDDELAAGPWFTVDDHDVFPEEFEHFLGIGGAQRRAFLHQHADLFDVQFWRRYQELHRAGAIIHFFPYPQERRFRRHDFRGELQPGSDSSE